MIEPSSSAAPVRIRRSADLHATPWKNGGGVTRELAAFPPHSNFADFIWRASVADVHADGAFSTFPGIDRQIALLEGAGLTLRFDAPVDGRLDEHVDEYANEGRKQALVEIGVPFAFPGEAQVHATLADGATRDFNLMVRRDDASGSVTTCRGTASQWLPPDAALLYVVRGATALYAGGEMHILNAGDSAQLTEPGPYLRCIGQQDDALVLLVRIQLKYE
jgi:environmental stress-induced protein Ves